MKILAGFESTTEQDRAAEFGPGVPLEASTATASLDPLIADMRRMHRRVGFGPLSEIRNGGFGAVRHACRLLRAMLEVDTAQDDTGRRAFELPCQVFAPGTLLNPIT
jgi:hypothetical protein